MGSRPVLADAGSMRVLLSDGSGLTARQTAGLLADAGHTVEVLSPDPVCLARFTRRVRRVWRVPPYGADPLRWLDAALGVYRAAGMDVPTASAPSLTASSTLALTGDSGSIADGMSVLPLSFRISGTSPA